MRTVLIDEETGLYRDPIRPLGKINKEIKFQSGKVLPEGTIVEVDMPFENPTIGSWREEGTSFALYSEDYEVIEEPIWPQLFQTKYSGEYIYWPEYL